MDPTSTVSRATLVGLRASAGVLHSLSIVVTGFRLVHRKQRKQFASDDWWALAAVCFNTVVFAFFWVRVAINDDILRGLPLPKVLAQATYYLMSIAFTCTLWSARISIACSILRVSHGERTRTFVLLLAWLFVIACLILVAAKSWICTTTTWTTDCHLGQPFNVSKLTTDVISNFALVVTPLYILWHTKLPRAPRYMIRAVFATSLLTTAISATHLVYAMGPNRFLDGYTAHFESAVTVLVCNLLVLVTYIYRRIRNGVDLEDEIAVESFTTRSRVRPGTASSPMSFTRISEPSSLDSCLEAGRGTSILCNNLQSDKDTRAAS